MGWDALLARADAESGGVMLDLPAEATPAAVQWQAVNCLYAGWPDLLIANGMNDFSGREHAINHPNIKPIAGHFIDNIFLILYLIA